MIKLPILDCKFILGFLSPCWHHIHLGWGGIIIWDFEILPYFDFLPQWAFVFHKHMSILYNEISECDEYAETFNLLNLNPRSKAETDSFPEIFH